MRRYSVHFLQIYVSFSAISIRIPKLILCIYFWLCWLFNVVWAFLWLWRAGAAVQLWSTGFSLQCSSCGAQVPDHGLSSCGTRAQLLCGTWDLPVRSYNLTYISRWILYYRATREAPTRLFEETDKLTLKQRNI